MGKVKYLNGSRIDSAERYLCFVLTSLALLLHLQFMLNAGALWRDEANSAFLATVPRLADLWQLLKYDSFPMLHFILIRFWTVFAGSGDGSLRAFGFMIGAGFIAALWFQARAVGVRAPLVALLLIGINPVFILTVDALRANGIAAIGTVLAFALTWRAVKAPDAVNLCFASTALVICVQSLYQGAFVVLALACGAFAAALRRGGLKRVLPVAVPFICAALSLLPYTGIINFARTWGAVAMVPSGSKSLLPGFMDAMAVPTTWFVMVWGAAAVMALVGLFRGVKKNSDKDMLFAPELLMYCGVTSIAGVALLMLLMVKLVDFNPQYWHFAPFLVLLVVAIEPLVEQSLSGGMARMVRLVLIGGIVAAILAPSMRIVQERMTCIDLVAAAVSREGLPRDLVIVSPWYYGISFNRYYTGKAPWVTFPSLQDNTIHRYDLLKEKMSRPDAVAEDVKRISTILKAGGRILLAGSLFGEVPEILPPLLPLPPHPVTGWRNGPYAVQWEQQLLRTLADHARFADPVDLPLTQPINPLEIPQLVVFHGWKE